MYKASLPSTLSEDIYPTLSLRLTSGRLLHQRLRILQIWRGQAITKQDRTQLDPIMRWMTMLTPPRPMVQSWLVILGASTCLFCTVGFLNSFGVFEEYYAANQLASSPQSTIAWLGAIAIFFLFSISVASGSILDMFGPKVGDTLNDGGIY